MRKALALLTLVLFVPAGLVTAVAAAKKAPARKAAKKTSKRRRAKKPPQSTWRTRQRSPTPERYREIQQALIKKGYLQEPGTGTWDSGSVAALRRFQQDQHLNASGKIDSLSLIALGLGPKYGTATAIPPPPPPKPPE